MIISFEGNPTTMMKDTDINFSLQYTSDLQCLSILHLLWSETTVHLYCQWRAKLTKSIVREHQPTPNFTKLNL